MLQAGMLKQPNSLPIVIGHNGSSEASSPSGSLDAFRSAIDVGAEMIEVDTRPTRDGTFVSSYAVEIDGQPIAKLSDANLPGSVPPVAEVIALARDAGVPVLLDLKDVGYEHEVVELATSILPQDRFRITTLEDESVAKISRAYPDVQVALNLGRSAPEDPLARVRTRLSELFPLARARACGARFLTVNYRHAALGVVRQADRAGYPVFVWTVDDPGRLARWLADKRIEGVITNRPTTAMRIKSTL
jgi:glycerophosphoryl diester phosphodiesterase